MRIKLDGYRAGLGQNLAIFAAWLVSVRTFELVVSDAIGNRIVAMGFAEIVDPDQPLDP